MIENRFHAMAAMRGWDIEQKAAVLPDYIVRQDSAAAFLDFVAQQKAHLAMTKADRFLWAVAELLQHRGLALEARFQLFCLDTFDLFTPDGIAAEWRRRTGLDIRSQGDQR